MIDAAAELRDIWVRFNSVKNWDDRTFNWPAASVCAAFARLAYAAYSERELDRRGRFKLVPSSTFRQAATAGRSLLTDEAWEASDVHGRFVVEGRDAVALGARLRNVVFLAVRGTASLHESSKWYDWRINLTALRTDMGNGTKLHRGFVNASLENAYLIQEQILRLVGKDEGVVLCITGHSLGGAIATMLYNFFDLEWFGRGGPTLYGRGIQVHSCYTFGMPRYGNLRAITSGNYPYHIAHERDVVPRLVLRALGYADCGWNMVVANAAEAPTAASAPFNIRDRVSGKIGQILHHHAVESYLATVDSLAKPAASRSHALGDITVPA